MNKTGSSGKSLMRANVIISMLGVIAIAAMLNYLSMRHYKRMDWTGAGIYTLSGKSAAVVKNIKKDVTVYVMWSKNDPLFKNITELLNGYRSFSPRLHVEIMDPDEDPEQFDLMQKKYAKVQVDELGQTGIEAGIFVISGKAVKFIPADSFQEISTDVTGQADESGGISFIAEQQITSALINVTSNNLQTICFTQGHGEWSFDGDGRDSLNHIKKELTVDGFLSRPVSLSASSTIPEACAALIIAGPKKTLLAKEAEAVESYFNNGGKVMLLLDPLFSGSHFFATGLEQFTKKNGIVLSRDFIFETDPRRLLSETPVTFAAAKFFNHSAVKPLYSKDNLQKPVVFSIVRSLKQIDGKNTVSDILAQTSSLSWGETSLESIQGGSAVPRQDEFDISGPLNIVMSAVGGTSQGTETGRLIVVGDSDFLSEELFENSSLYNRDFWTSITGWLTRRRDMISIAPKNPAQTRLILSDSDLTGIVIMLFLQLLLIIAAGTAVIYRRKNR
jgi:hypothetical protein